MKKSIAAATIAATTFGGVAGAIVLGPGIAGAQDDTETQTFDSYAEKISETLQPLVDDGTIDDSQRDAVVDQLESSRPEGGRGHGPGQRGQRGAAFSGDIAEILGLDSSEIGEALRNGESLADLAAANGVDSQDLVDALVASIEERVNGAIEEGHIDADKAAEILADASERAEDKVNGVFEPGERGHRGRGFGGPGFGGPGPDGTDSETSA